MKYSHRFNLIALFVLSVSFTSVVAQEKCKSVIFFAGKVQGSSLLKDYKKHLNQDISFGSSPTGMGFLVEKTMKFKSEFAMLKTANAEYYLYLYLGSYTGRFNITIDTPMKIGLEDNSEIIIYPIKDGDRITGGPNKLSVFYTLTKQQIEKFSLSHLDNVKIYFSAEKELKGSAEDELGSYFNFDFEKGHKWFMKTAKCMLQSELVN